MSGSGLGKIIENYEVEELYTDEKKPQFFSDAIQFRVILPNLNYDVPQDVPQDVRQGGTQDGTQDNIEERIINLINQNNNIHYIGSGYSGHWKKDKIRIHK